MLQEKIDLVQKLYRLERSANEVSLCKMVSNGGVNPGTIPLLQQQSSTLTHQQQLQLHNQQEERKRRHRRSASQIERHYCCPFHECSKSYGSEGSLQQHLKIKHPDFNIKDFQFRPTTLQSQDSAAKSHTPEKQNYNFDSHSEDIIDEKDCNDELNQENANELTEITKPNTNNDFSSKKRGRLPLSSHN